MIMGKATDSEKIKKMQKQPNKAGNTALQNGAAAANPDLKQANFEAWLDEADVEWRDSCRLGDADDRGQGVFATRDVAAGDVVLSVPDAAVLMPDDCCIVKVSRQRYITRESKCRMMRRCLSRS